MKPHVVEGKARRGEAKQQKTKLPVRKKVTKKTQPAGLVTLLGLSPRETHL